MKRRIKRTNRKKNLRKSYKKRSRRSYRKRSRKSYKKRNKQKGDKLSKRRNKLSKRRDKKPTIMRLKIKNVNKKYYQRGGNLNGIEIIDDGGGVWTISNILGEGNMAQVYLVTNMGGEHRALKAITGGTDSEIENEINILQQLSNITHETDSRSNYIVKLLSKPLDVESLSRANSIFQDYKALIMMEYVNGGDLKTFIETAKKDNSVNLDLVASYFLNMYDGLCFVHEQNIIHCDIKPANFLIGEGGVKLTDFGFAQPWSEAEEVGAPTYKGKEQGVAFDPVGTLLYISPEICKEWGVGRKTDLWALGVCLYELVMLKCPFYGQTQKELESSIKGDEPIQLTQVNRGGLGGDTFILRIFRDIVNDFLKKEYSARNKEGTTHIEILRRHIAPAPEQKVLLMRALDLDPDPGGDPNDEETLKNHLAALKKKLSTAWGEKVGALDLEPELIAQLDATIELLEGKIQTTENRITEVEQRKAKAAEQRKAKAAEQRKKIAGLEERARERAAKREELLERLEIVDVKMAEKKAAEAAAATRIAAMQRGKLGRARSAGLKQEEARAAAAGALESGQTFMQDGDYAEALNSFESGLTKELSDKDLRSELEEKICLVKALMTAGKRLKSGKDKLSSDEFAEAGDILKEGKMELENFSESKEEGHVAEQLMGELEDAVTDAKAKDTIARLEGEYSEKIPNYECMSPSDQAEALLSKKKEADDDDAAAAARAKADAAFGALDMFGDDSDSE